jgi:hypothetical protein
VTAHLLGELLHFHSNLTNLSKKALSFTASLIRKQIGSFCLKKRIMSYWVTKTELSNPYTRQPHTLSSYLYMTSLGLFTLKKIYPQIRIKSIFG